MVDEAGAAVVTVAGGGFWTVRSDLKEQAAVAATSAGAQIKRSMKSSLPAGAAWRQRRWASPVASLLDDEVRPITPSFRILPEGRSR